MKANSCHCPMLGAIITNTASLTNVQNMRTHTNTYTNTYVLYIIFSVNVVSYRRLSAAEVSHILAYQPLHLWKETLASYEYHLCAGSNFHNPTVAAITL